MDPSTSKAQIPPKDASAVQIRNKQDLYHALTDRETLYKIIEQALDYKLSDKVRDTFEKIVGQSFYEQDKQRLCEQYQNNKDKIVDYFMKVKDKVKLEELRFLKKTLF